MINFPLDEPLAPAVARRLIQHIWRNGVVSYSRHARARMVSHGMRRLECEQVLRSGWVMPGEWEHGTWRYRVRTQNATVVVTFLSIQELVVVTTWRER